MPTSKTKKKPSARSSKKKNTAVAGSRSKKAVAKKTTARKATPSKSSAVPKTAKKKVSRTGTANKASAQKTKRIAAPKTVRSQKVAPSSSKVKPKKPSTPRERMLLSIKSQLLRQKETLLSEAESALNELPGQTIFPDLGDQASAEIDRDFLLRLRGREQRLLKKIDDAIDRIDSGIFGICEDCGNEIDIKRLLARPVTTMCIECKTLQEEEERRRES